MANTFKDVSIGGGVSGIFSFLQDKLVISNPHSRLVLNILKIVSRMLSIIKPNLFFSYQYPIMNNMH